MPANHSYYQEMRRLQSQHVATANSALRTTEEYDALSDDGLFILSERRRMELACILEEFKNRPLNQRNYMELQRELRAAELMPEQLFGHLSGLEAQVRNNHYMSRIVQSWQRMNSRGKL
jgi:hypothetical protein